MWDHSIRYCLSTTTESSPLISPRFGLGRIPRVAVLVVHIGDVPGLRAILRPDDLYSRLCTDRTASI